MSKEVKYVSYEEAMDKEGFVISKWTAFVKENGSIRKEKKDFDWTITTEQAEMTEDRFAKLVSVR